MERNIMKIVILNMKEIFLKINMKETENIIGKMDIIMKGLFKRENAWVWKDL